MLYCVMVVFGIFYSIILSTTSVTLITPNLNKSRDGILEVCRKNHLRQNKEVGSVVDHYGQGTIDILT